MTGLIADCWKRLETSAPLGENVLARPAFPDVTHRLLAGVDARGHRHLLIGLTDDEEEHSDSRGRGLAVRTQLLSVVNQQSARYLDIECMDSGGFAAFDALAVDLASRLAGGDSSPAEAVQRTVSKWRHFWGLNPIVLLTREEQLGLFAELWFLEFWLKPVVGAAEAVSRWRGPLGGRHDFAWQKASAEVKATTSSRGRLFRVNGLEQLAEPESGDLYFFGLRVQEDASASNNLPGVIARVRESLNEDAEANAVFETLLKQAGYIASHELEYGRMTLAVQEEALFKVTSDFPRLVSEDLASQTCPAIEEVNYLINLNGYDRLVISNNEKQRVALS